MNQNPLRHVSGRERQLRATFERAIRCYAAAGFYPVGPVITPDGQALLMRCTRQSLSKSV
jgi:hypothetical protein